jgi:hypothetical protein
LKVENTLFGWVLRAGREQIPCASEAEARLLAALASLGFTEIPIPDDAQVLRDTVEDLEKAVSALWGQVEEAVSSEINPNQRRELLGLVWEEIRDKIGIPASKRTESAIS